MTHFKRLGLPLDAALNQEKNRVMTPTNGQKLTKPRKQSDEPQPCLAGNSAKDRVPHEITDGIRVLGTPVGHATFCRKFITEAIKKVKEHSSIILDKLPSKLSAFQLYKFCASRKMTHLFGANDLIETVYPRHWNTGEVICAQTLMA